MPNAKGILKGIESGWDTATSFLHTAADSGTLPFMRSVERSGGNYWIGLRPKKWVTGVAVAGFGAYAVAKTAFDNKISGPRKEATANGERVGTMPSMRYERTGYDLGASGDIVLGLNNMRRGR